MYSLWTMALNCFWDGPDASGDKQCIKWLQLTMMDMCRGYCAA